MPPTISGITLGAGKVITSQVGSGVTDGANTGANYVTSTFTPFDDGSKIAWIKNSRTNHADGNIANLRNKIEQVNQHIKKHDTTAFVKFKVNGFELDTRDADSFKHYAISMENQKTGVGQGNQFKIKIAYHKHFSNYQSINQLEYALGPTRNGSLLTYNSNTMSSARTDLNRNKCTLQYGYLEGGQSLVSPEYVGLLLKYSITANKQIVEYTLEGFTGEQVAVNTVNWYPNIRGMDYGTLPDGTKVGKAMFQLKNAKSKLSDTQLQEIASQLNTVYTGGIVFQPYLALDCFLQDYNASVSSNSTRYYLLDCTGKQSPDNLSNENTLEPVRMSICRNQTPIQYIEYCIGLFKYKKTTNYALQYLEQQRQTSERFVYTLVKDKNDDNKVYICVDYIDSSDSDNKVAYEFTGYATDNNLLIDYNLNYDGTVALAVADNYEDSNSSNSVLYIGNDGVIRQKTSITRDMFVAGEIDEVLIAKQNTWLDKISVANNVTMTTFGLPFEITVGTVFKCGLYITDTLHHTSGNCFVTSITDKIENSSFTSQFNMIRLPGANSKINETF